MEPLFIFGSSGFARETNDVAHALGYEATFITSSEEERDAWQGPERVLLEEEIDRYGDAAFAIGIGDNGVRRKIAGRYGGRMRFVNLIHPTASFGKGQRERIEQARGVIVCAGVRFTNGITVGDFAIFNLNATVGHDCIIGDFVNVAPGANLSGYVHLRERVWVGTNAAVNQGVPGRWLEIGAGTVIGSGSVVVKDCESDSVYVGIPAKKR
jgi:sugar O-acyltransferase (sialic acid O-acetyltransferase NeuD family)